MSDEESRSNKWAVIPHSTEFLFDDQITAQKFAEQLATASQNLYKHIRHSREGTTQCNFTLAQWDDEKKVYDPIINWPE